MIKKYYVGAKHIGYAILQGQNASCMHSTEEDAISDATNKIEEGAEIAVVVEIKYVVRRERPPVRVEPV